MVTAWHSAKILIAGDDQAGSSSLRDILDHLGESCDIVISKQSDALKAAGEGDFDVIVLDVRGVTDKGAECCRQFHDSEIALNVPVMLLTSDNLPEMFVADGLPAPLFDIVRCPVTPDELISRVRMMIRMKRAEDSLREMRQRLESLLKSRTRQLVDNEYYYRTLLHGLHDDVLVIDSDYVIADVNNAFLASTGFKRRDVLGKHCYEVSRGYHGPCERSSQKCPLPRAFSTGEPYHCQHTHTRSDGSKIHVDILMSPLLDEAGKVTHVVEAARDITLIVEAQEALAKEHAILEAVIEGIDDAIFVKDVEGRILLANAAACRTLGQDRQDVLGRTAGEILGPEAVQQAVESDALVLSSGRSHVVEQRLNYNGSERVWLTANHPRRDAKGNITGLIVVSRDITERKRAEEELRREKDFAENLIATAQTIILLLDKEGRIIRFNPYMEEVSGYRLDEVVGKEWFSTFLPQRDQGRIRSLFHNAFAGTRTKGVVNSIVTRDGRERQIEWQDSPLTGEHGEQIGLLSIGQDITERKLLEEKFRQAQKMEAVGQLAGGVAHDFKNQLTVIAGYAEMLLRRSMVTKEGRSKVEEIVKAAERSANITTQLLTFSRKQHLRPQVTDLVELIGEMTPMLGRLVGDNVRVAVIASSQPCTTEVDPALLQQAVMNLAVNAGHAMPDGGRLTVEVGSLDGDDALLGRHSEASQGDYAFLSLSDTGMGMDEETLERIFDPFFTTKQPGEGTGMGLSMVQGFVAQSAGFVDVQSRPGEGSTFTLCFPRVEPGRAVPAPETAPVLEEPSMCAGGTALVVEDEDAVRHLVAGMMSDLGYTVLEAASADQALPLGEHYEDEIHVLVTDLSMPGMDGAELARRLRCARPGIAVLFVSGLISKYLSLDELALPRTDVLAKPFANAEFKRKIQELVQPQEEVL